MSTELPILFSGELVRALLAGRKTQTRRLVTPMAGQQSLWLTRDMIDASPALTLTNVVEGDVGAQMEHPAGGPLGWVRCPYGAPGEMLWVREAWGLLDTQPSDGPDHATVFYRATDGERHDLRYQRWRPSIHMPRWASRLRLRVTGVRVQRLQDISEEDARAEGVEPFGDRYSGISLDQRIPGCGTAEPCRGPGCCFRAGDQPHRSSFAVLWDELNGDRARWSRNPWVWAVTFEAVR